MAELFAFFLVIWAMIITSETALIRTYRTCNMRTCGDKKYI